MQTATFPVAGPGTIAAATVEIVVPVYNEAGEVEVSIRRLHAYLATSFPLRSLITIADNASTDGTMQIAAMLSDELDNVIATHLDEKGRGRALKAAWLEGRRD
ncbi:MAG: glycosyltransferase [Acidimicrobiales bacterium]